MVVFTDLSLFFSNSFQEICFTFFLFLLIVVFPIIVITDICSLITYMKSFFFHYNNFGLSIYRFLEIFVRHLANDA